MVPSSKGKAMQLPNYRIFQLQGQMFAASKEELETTEIRFPCGWMRERVGVLPEYELLASEDANSLPEQMNSETSERSSRKPTPQS